MMSINSEHARDKKVVLLTGASSGLGLTLAKKLIKEKRYFLILTCREASCFRFHSEKIHEDKDVWIRNLNVIDHKQVKSVIDEINSKLGGVDILINNAGISERSTVEDSDDICRQRQLDVNYLAPFELIGQVLPSMREKKWGRVINISSASGFMAMPTMSSYSASKSALESASESLWYEMKPWDIGVTLIVPGFIKSLSYLNTRETGQSEYCARNRSSPYYEHYKNMKELIAKQMSSSYSTNEKVADKIINSLTDKTPPLRLHVGIDSWLFFLFRKIFPTKLYHFTLYNSLPNIKKWGRGDFHKRTDTQLMQ